MMKTRLKQAYQHTVLTIYIRHKYNTTAAHEKRIFFLFSKTEKFKSQEHFKRKNLLQLVQLLIPNQATLYNKKIAAYQFLLCSVQSTIKVKLRKK